MTVAVADGRDVVVPIIGPESSVTLGLAEARNARGSKGRMTLNTCMTMM